MSKTLDSTTFGKKLYNTLPSLYHNEDSMVDYALKRYLQALSDGGFKFVIDEANGILDLNDPDKTPFEVLSILFEQYGLPLFNGLPESYLRKLLPILGDLYARKGATTVIEYLTSIISDVKSEVIVSPDFLEDYHIDLKLEMDYDQSGSRDIPDREQLLRIINEFLPFFINVTIIFSYLFYEVAKLQAKEEFSDSVTEVRNDDARIVSKKGEGLFPVLNNLSLGLNKDFYLNESYYYDVDVDWFRDHIVYHFLESGKMDRSKSHQYLKQSLNVPSVITNRNFILSDFMDTDELVSTDITLKAQEDRVNIRESYSELIERVKQSLNDEGSMFSVGVPKDDNAVFNYGVFGKAVFNKGDFKWLTDDFSDVVKDVKSDSGSIYSDSTQVFRPQLNNLDFTLNQRLVLNRGTKPDDFEDSVVEVKSEKGTFSKVEEFDTDIISTQQTISEESGITRIALPTQGSSRFMQAVFGEAIFAKDSEGVVEVYEDKVSYSVVEESAGVKRQFTDKWSKGTNTLKTLNNDLTTNELEENDVVEDLITHEVLEQSSIDSDDSETHKTVMGLYMLFPVLNTGKLLNIGIMTNDSNNEIGIVNFEEMVYDKIITNGETKVVVL